MVPQHMTGSKYNPKDLNRSYVNRNGNCIRDIFSIGPKLDCFVSIFLFKFVLLLHHSVPHEAKSVNFWAKFGTKVMSFSPQLDDLNSIQPMPIKQIELNGQRGAVASNYPFIV